MWPLTRDAFWWLTIVSGSSENVPLKHEPTFGAIDPIRTRYIQVYEYGGGQ